MKFLAPGIVLVGTYELDKGAKIVKQTKELLSIWKDLEGRWFYTVECYPYAAADQFVTYGPFETRLEAEDNAVKMCV